MNDRDFITSIRDQCNTQLGTVIPPGPVVPPVVPPGGGGGGTPPPVGNPIIVPVPSPFNSMLVYPAGGQGFTMPAGQVAAIEVPQSGGDGVTLYVGQMPISPPIANMEFYLSRTPGEINPVDGNNYVTLNPFANQASVKVWYSHTYYSFGKMIALPPGLWYLNVRWSAPGGYSVTWNF